MGLIQQNFLEYLPYASTVLDALAGILEYYTAFISTSGSKHLRQPNSYFGVCRAEQLFYVLPHSLS